MGVDTKVTDEMCVIVARIFCGYGDTGFDWDDADEEFYGGAEMRAAVLGDARKALEAALAAATSPKGNAEGIMASKTAESTVKGTDVTPDAAPATLPEEPLRLEFALMGDEPPTFLRCIRVAPTADGNLLIYLSAAERKKGEG